MISRCDECRRFFKHPIDEPEKIVEEFMVDGTRLGEEVRYAIRQKVSMRLCERCLP